MVVLDESMEEDVYTIETVAKHEKAHNKPIVGMWSFRFGNGVALMTVGHDSAKFWVLKENRRRNEVSFSEQACLAKWRPAVQSADVTEDGKYAVVIGLDSTIHEIFLDNEIRHEKRDFGYLEALHVSIASTKRTYVTSSYSGNLSEIEVGTSNLLRREPFHNYKQVSVLKYSRDMRYLAVGQNDGAIELFETSNMKSVHKYEVHSMRIRKIEFLPDEERFLSACDDRLIKLHSLKNIGNSDNERTSTAIRIFASHDSPILALAIDDKSAGTRFASSSSTGQIFIWNIELAHPICLVSNEHEALITGLSFSPTGRHLFSAGDESSIFCYRVPSSGEDSPIQEDEEEVVDNTEMEDDQTIGETVDDKETNNDTQFAVDTERTMYYDEVGQNYEEEREEPTERLTGYQQVIPQDYEQGYNMNADPNYQYGQYDENNPTDSFQHYDPSQVQSAEYASYNYNGETRFNGDEYDPGNVQ